DANYFTGNWIRSTDAQTFAQSLARVVDLRPQAVRQLLADDCNRGRLDRVLRSEISPTKKRRTNGLEIFRADANITGEDPVVGRNLSVFRNDRCGQPYKTERQQIGHTRCLHTRQPFKSLDNPLIK